MIVKKIQFLSVNISEVLQV